MKGGSDYCLINTEVECPHLLKRIRSAKFESVGDPTREWDETLGPLLQGSGSSLCGNLIHNN